MKIRRLPPGDQLEVLSGGSIVVRSGGTLQVDPGAVLSVGDALQAPSDIALADNHILVGDNTGKAKDVAMSGDVHIDDTGATAIQAGAVTQTKIAAASLDGTVAAVGADDNVIGTIPLLFRINIAAGALATKNILMTHKVRVIDAWLRLNGAGVATTTLTVGNDGAAISNAMAASGADEAVVRCATLDDATHEILAGHNLSVQSLTGASQPAATVYVLCERVA